MRKEPKMINYKVLNGITLEQVKWLPNGVSFLILFINIHIKLQGEKKKNP